MIYETPAFWHPRSTHPNGFQEISGIILQRFYIQGKNAKAQIEVFETAKCSGRVERGSRQKTFKRRTLRYNFIFHLNSYKILFSMYVL